MPARHLGGVVGVSRLERAGAMRRTEPCREQALEREDALALYVQLVLPKRGQRVLTNRELVAQSLPFE
jgi:hypothetical protein